MSKAIKTMAHMVNHRAADIETTRRIEQQKEERLEAIRAHVMTLDEDSVHMIRHYYPELFDNEEGGK